MLKTITAMYFSPTHTSQTITRDVSMGLSQALGIPVREVDLTAPAERRHRRCFGPEDLLLFGFPVYGGRLPPVLEDTVSQFRGEWAPAVLLALYGNRDFDDALLEASDLLAQNGFTIAAAGAFIGEHSYSRKLAAGRPDKKDREAAAVFAGQIAEKLQAGNTSVPHIPGNRPYKERKPSSPEAPKTRDSCTRCGICAEACPMGIISRENPFLVAGGCISCCACIKSCPISAKHFDSAHISAVTEMLETNFMGRKEPSFFL